MANDGFTPKQLEQLGLLIKPINERLTNVENRLTKIENCPTIQKEIKED